MKTQHYSLNPVASLIGSACHLLAVLVLAGSSIVPGASAKEPDPHGDVPPVEQTAKSGMEPRSADESLQAGLEYLLKQQQEDGGWGQGGGWRQKTGEGGGRVEGANVEDPSDLGNTCVSLVTLLRAGHSPSAGEHREAMLKAFEYVCRVVEKADSDSLYVTPVRDTQLQVKIGSYVDTFLAAWVLSEIKGKLGDGDDGIAEKRRAAALDKVVAKIERHQRDDGSFAENRGWAAVLSQGLCSKALNAAAVSGAKVSPEALDRDQKQNVAGLDLGTGDFSATTMPSEPTSAGISLYREAAKLGGLRAKLQSNVARQSELEQTIADPSAPDADKEEAQQQINQFRADEEAAQVAGRAVAGKLGDRAYVAGFGNNGGEEFLSYLTLGESMHERGGDEWKTWKTQMEKTLTTAQNADGSWAGNHCITGRTFCTGTALLTLMVERTPVGAALSKAGTDIEKEEVSKVAAKGPVTE